MEHTPTIDVIPRRPGRDAPYRTKHLHTQILPGRERLSDPARQTLRGLRRRIFVGPPPVARERDAIYGSEFQRRVEGMGLVQVPIAPRSPWQNGYAERFVGSLRRECLDHVIALNERQVCRIVSSYARYYNCARSHLALAKGNRSPRDGMHGGVSRGGRASSSIRTCGSLLVTADIFGRDTS